MEEVDYNRIELDIEKNECIRRMYVELAIDHDRMGAAMKGEDKDHGITY